MSFISNAYTLWLNRSIKNVLTTFEIALRTTHLLSKWKISKKLKRLWKLFVLFFCTAHNHFVFFCSN